MYFIENHIYVVFFPTQAAIIENPVCFRIFIRNEKFNGWIFSYIIFGILIPSLSIIICIFYIKIFFFIKISKENFSNQKKTKSIFKDLKLSTFLLPIINLTIWIPIFILGSFLQFSFNSITNIF